MSDTVTAEQIFDAAIRVQVCGKKNLEVKFSPDHVRVLLPTKRVLAAACSVPMSKMTAILSEMEQDQLIGAEQRGGMWATPLGNRMISGLLARKYRQDAEALLGPLVLKTLLERLSCSAPADPV